VKTVEVEITLKDRLKHETVIAVIETGLAAMLRRISAPNYFSTPAPYELICTRNEGNHKWRIALDVPEEFSQKLVRDMVCASFWGVFNYQLA
jgi:hypothetical protein